MNANKQQNIFNAIIYLYGCDCEALYLHCTGFFRDIDAFEELGDLWDRLDVLLFVVAAATHGDILVGAANHFNLFFGSDSRRVRSVGAAHHTHGIEFLHSFASRNELL